jgi:sulfoxide reductase heme-binding subunit YedZ
MAARPRGAGSAPKINWLWWAANAAAASPLVLMVWDYSQGVLGIDPVNAINNRTGRTAIILLFASLACTPLNVLFGWRQVLGLRKSLGLWAVGYAGLHLLNFVGLDYAFNLGQIMQDAVLDKPYILAGLAALLLLLPLALTSTRGWMRRLGKNWKRLHRLAYAAGVLAALHFLWQAKAAERWEPLIYAVVLGALLAVRLPPVRRTLARWRTGAPKSHPAQTSARLAQKHTAGAGKPRPLEP